MALSWSSKFFADGTKVRRFIDPDRIRITDMCTIITDLELPYIQQIEKVITLII